MRLTPRAVPLGVVLLVTSVTASSAYAASPVLLPATKTKVSVAGAQRVSCATRSLTGGAVSRRTVTAPADGSVTARLAGPASSDWDLAVVDSKTGNVLNGSAELGSTEIATTAVRKGQKLIIQSCLRKGSARTVSQSVQFTKAKLATAAKVKLVRVNFRTDFDREALQTLQPRHDRSPEPGLPGRPAARRRRRGEAAEVGLTYSTRVADVVAKDRTERLADLKRGRSAKGRKAARALTPGGRTSYRTLPEIQQELKDTAAANPGLVRTFALPQRSIEGRQIMGIEIAENVNGAPDGRPAFVTVGTHHAREWPSNEATQEFGLELINGYKSGNADLKRDRPEGPHVRHPGAQRRRLRQDDRVRGPEPRRLLHRPGRQRRDERRPGRGLGRLQAQELLALTDPAEQAIPCLARTYDPADGDDQSAQNDRGVDPNRNYGVSWGGPGSATDVDSLTYHGPTPFSEPETRTFADFLRDQQVSLLFTNHTFSGLILRPPGTSVNGPAPDEQGLRQLGDAMAKKTRYLSQFSYQLYDTTGTTDDYIYDGLGGYSYTAEIGLNEFHPPYTEFQSEYDGVPRPTTTATRRATSSAACAAPTRSPASRPSARRATTAAPRTRATTSPVPTGSSRAPRRPAAR